MAPKRKAASSSKAEPAPKKRSTRTAAAASSEPDPASSSPPAKKPSVEGKGKTSSSASAKPSKGKSKKQEIVLSSDSEHESDDSDLSVEQPRKKSKAAPAKGKAPSKPKSKGALAAHAPVEGSTSTPAESMVPAPRKKDKKPVKVMSLPEWFAQFADKSDPGKMDGDGIEKLFDDMGLSMDGVYPLLLAWKVGAKPGTFGAFFLKDFERAFRKDGIDSSEKLKKYLVKQEKKILKSSSGSKKKRLPGADDDSAADFRQFYAFLLPFFRAEGAKTLPADTAKAMWTVVLAPKYDLAKGFVEFAEEQGDKFKAVSTDLWTQLLDFCESIEPDLTGWSEDDAWPSAIDAFVEWKKEKDAAAAS